MPKLNPCILVADNDRNVPALQRVLETEKYRVITAGSGESVLAAFEKQPVDMLLFDIMMPGTDGYAVCQTIRRNSNVPIIMLTTMGNDQAKVKGLDAGADEFVTKPFSIDVLLATIRAMLRRSSSALPAPSRANFSNGSLEIDFANRRASMDGREVRLTPTEFRLTQELTLNTGKVLTHTHLLQTVWGPEYQNATEYLHVFVRGLRVKFGLKRQGSGAIESISGIGYRFNA